MAILYTDHKKHLKLAIDMARNELINPDNFECFWYAPWNVVLVNWFNPPLFITPQHTLVYSTEDRENKNKVKSVIPDFTVSSCMYKGTNTNKYLLNTIHLTIENKRGEGDMQEFIKEIKETHQGLIIYGYT